MPGNGAAHPDFVRLTAADRPGVAQPVPERDIPERPWGAIWLGATLLALVLMVLMSVLFPGRA